MNPQAPAVSGPSLVQLFEFAYNVIRANLAGISHEESLIQPARAGNCVNWVFGHVLATRMHMLRLLGETPPWTAEETARYDRGSEPMLDGKNAISLERMKSDFDVTQERLRAGLARLTPERMAQPMPPNLNPLKVDSVGEMVGALLFHESYHSGQTGILRRILGKDGAIR